MVNHHLWRTKQKREEVYHLSNSPKLAVFIRDFFPEKVITDLSHFRQAFSLPSFRHFQGVIAAVLLVEG